MQIFDAFKITVCAKLLHRLQWDDKEPGIAKDFEHNAHELQKSNVDPIGLAWVDSSELC